MSWDSNSWNSQSLYISIREVENYVPNGSTPSRQRDISTNMNEHDWEKILKNWFYVVGNKSTSNKS